MFLCGCGVLMWGACLFFFLRFDGGWFEEWLLGDGALWL